MAALRATPLFAALPGPALETVAREARRVEAASGEVVVRQGEPGMEYFAVVSGCLTVSIDGKDRAELRRGDAFGEIALIREVPAHRDGPGHDRCRAPRGRSGTLPHCGDRPRSHARSRVIDRVRAPRPAVNRSISVVILRRLTMEVS